MSLTGGGFFGSGAKSSKTTSYTTVNNTSTAFEDVSGVAISGSGNVLTLSDAGAVKSAELIATDAIEAARNIAGGSIEGQLEAQRSSLEFSSRAIDTGFDLAKLGIDGQERAFTDALAFADKARAGERSLFESVLLSTGASRDAAFQFSEGLFGGSLAFANERTAAALEFADRTADRGNVFSTDLFSKALNAVTGQVTKGQETLASTVTALNTIAREQSTSTDERVQAIASTALKVGGWIAGAVILFALWRTRG